MRLVRERRRTNKLPRCSSVSCLRHFARLFWNQTCVLHSSGQSLMKTHLSAIYERQNTIRYDTTKYFPCAEELTGNQLSSLYRIETVQKRDKYS